MKKKYQLTFSGPSINLSDVPTTHDGALLLNAKAMRSGEYEYFGFELMDSQNRGYEWDQKIIGFMEDEEVKKILDSFEGLPVTDDHVWVPVGERKKHACGTVLKPGEMDNDGFVDTRVEIHDPSAILKVTNGTAQELSIGFLLDVEWNEGRTESEPHFYMRNVVLNHVAIVGEGRAGPEARLSHHKATLESDNVKKIMLKNGKEFEVEDDVAAEFEQLGADNQSLTNSLSKTEGERDSAVGQLAVVNQKLENAKSNVTTEASKIALEHSAFIDQATKLGHDVSSLTIGSYDLNEEKSKILNGMGVSVPEKAGKEYVNGAWSVALEHVKPMTNSSPLDNVDPEPTASDQTVAESARSKIENSYFGKGDKE